MLPFNDAARAVLLSLFLSTVASDAVAQQPFLLADDSSTTMPTADPEPAGGGGVSKATPTAQPTPLSEKIDRWIDIKELSFSSRYRSETATDSFALFANGQQRSAIAGSFKLDASAHYTVGYRVSSGRTFNWAYADVIEDDFLTREAPNVSHVPISILMKLGQLEAAGYTLPAVPSRGWEMSPRQLFLSATPVNGLTVEYGSLYIERGKGSEITTYDDDGYIAGERLRLSDKKHLYFDEIAVTYAYEGDILTPNFINRTKRLAESNYHQFLIAKDFTSRVGASTDYTFDKKTHTIREAAYVKLPETRILDSLRAECYQRLNTVQAGPFPLSGGSGFAFTGEKTLYTRFKLDGGYEQVDAHFGATVDNVIAAVFGFSMNGDSYSTGDHVFAHANIKLTPFTSISGFYIHQTQSLPPGEFGFAKQGFNGALNIDLKSLLNSRQKVL